MAIAGLYKIFDHWHQQGTVWIYSDTHFGDKELPNRPSDEEQIKLINSKVGKKDTLILLGDVGDIECARHLKGYKVLVMGNHDAGRSNYERKRVTKKFDVEHYTQTSAISMMKTLFPGWRFTIEAKYDFHKPFQYWEITADNILFDEVYEGPLMIAEKLIFSHEPIPNFPFAFNIHGHVHCASHKNDNLHFNCCAEAINYTPVNFNQFMKAGYLSKVNTIHRETIDTATARKKKRIQKKGKKYG